MTQKLLSADTLFDLLKNRRRRYLLYALNESTSAVVTLDELTGRILEWERRMNAGVEAPTAELKERIRISLHHVHLPKVSESGLIEYDYRSKTIHKETMPSAAAFLDDLQDEVPHLRSLFQMSATS